MLLIHVIVALTHILQLLITRRSSACWDTVEDIITLAQISRTETKDLLNTGGGISRFSTMALNTRIRSSPAGPGDTEKGLADSNEEGPGILQLIVCSDTEDGGLDRVQVDEEYS